MARVLALVASVLWLAGCAAPGALSPPPVTHRVPASRDWSFVVRFDADLEALDVTVCFRGAAPERLYASTASATRHLVRAELRTPRGAARRELRRERRSIWLDGVPNDGCVGYVVRMGGQSTSRQGRRVGDAALLDAGTWLWRPSPRAAGATGVLRFEPPEGMDVAVSWAPAPGGGGFLIDESVFDFLSHTVFGRFERQRIVVPGGVLDVVRMQDAPALSPDVVARWLGTAARAVSEVEGRFPVQRALVVLVPVDGRGAPVAFGDVGRGGGASVMLLVDRDARLADLLDEWVTPHELSHLTMPFVRREDAWLSEGVATYYQEVLRARVGVRDPLDAWQALDAGFEAARLAGTGRALREESQAMFRTGAFRRVYWSGTAIALLYDVGLRRRGGEVGSLDDALRLVARCCGRRVGPWTAAGLVRQLDRVAGGEPVLSGIARVNLASREFPDLEDTYRWLGLLRGEDGRIRLLDGAPGARVRDAIMAPSSAPAAPPGGAAAPSSIGP